MTWADLYLVCFVVGLALSLLTLLVGVLHIDFPGRWDNFLHAGHGLHAHGNLHLHAHPGGHGGTADISPINFSTLMAFLTWFGGIGFLLSRHTSLIKMLVLGFAILGGLFGGAIIFWYMTKFLLRHDHAMDPADFDLVGTIGTLCVPIREDGVGEIVYEQNGARKSHAARSESGRAIAKGEEVAITRFEKGIAYVRRWSELTEEQEVKSQLAE